jgi:hypothetical protein
MIKPVAFAVFALAYLAAAGLRAAENNAPRTERPCVVLTGPDSRIGERSYRHVTSEDEWIELWQRHKGAKESEHYDLYYNPLGLPYIDFENYTVIAVFEGWGWNSAGLRWVELSEGKDEVVLTYESKGYQTAGPDGGGEQVTVYGFFVLPHFNKTIVLKESPRTLAPGPRPAPEEVARFAYRG